MSIRDSVKNLLTVREMCAEAVGYDLSDSERPRVMLNEGEGTGSTNNALLVEYVRMAEETYIREHVSEVLELAYGMIGAELGEVRRILEEGAPTGESKG